MKYPSIVIGNVRYEPYALIEMEGEDVVSFRRLVEGRPDARRWLNRIFPTYRP